MKNYLSVLVLALAMAVAEDAAAQQMRSGQTRSALPAAGNPWAHSTVLNRQRQVGVTAPQRAANAQQAAAMRAERSLGNAIMPYSTVGSAERAPTGHVTAYLNLGGYYAQPGNFAGYYPQKAAATGVRSQGQGRR